MPSNKPNYQKDYIRKHYANNKDYYKQKAKEYKLKVIGFNKRVLDRYKLLCGCIDCGYNKHPHALHFDHLRDKIQPVSVMLARGSSLKTIKIEIRKCEVRCANCHAIITAERRTTSACLI